MSRSCLLGGINDHDIRSIEENPDRVELLLNHGEYLQEAPPAGWQKLFRKSAPQRDTRWKPDLSLPTFNLGRSQYILHYIFTGTADGGLFPENFLVSGGKEIGADMGYGPVRFFSSTEVEDIRHYLEHWDTQKVLTRIDIQALREMHIYPSFHFLANEELTWVTREFEQLKAYATSVGRSGLGIYMVTF